MNASSDTPSPSEVPQRLTRVEARLARIEEHLRLRPATTGAPVASPAVATRTRAEQKAAEDEIEFEIGQNWFAKVGIVVLTAGLVFTLAHPFPGLPAWLPPAAGYGVALALFAAAHLGRSAFTLLSRFLFGAGMVLLFFATLRLSAFGEVPPLAPSSALARGLLVLAVVLNLGLGLHRRSPYLTMLAILGGFVAALAVNTPWFVLIALTALAAVLALVRMRYAWPFVLLSGIPLLFLTYLLWALNNPAFGGTLRLVTEPAAAPWFLLGYTLLLAAGTFLRPDREIEDPVSAICSILICLFGYGAFLFHTLKAPQAPFVTWHLGAALVFIGLAIIFWIREQSRISTFIYAMTGYMALSFAILRAIEMPNVFVWLSLQSLVVVTTAIWFRSRFIVVANFLIFVGIVLGYTVVATSETGISIGFGIVALVTARILNWKRDRLELTTEMMRNAYLVSAFAIFPYALYHLVAPSLVAFAWVGIALLYYALYFTLGNRKYRWMGHSTLGLTVLYVTFIGITRLEPAQRNLSFLVLGVVLLIVSLVFTRVQTRKHADGNDGATEGKG